MPSITSMGGGQKQTEGSTDKLGDDFTYRYKNIHSCKIKLGEVIPNKKVVWLVLDNYSKFTEDKKEWKDTKIVFDVSEKGGFDKTGLQQRHRNICEIEIEQDPG